MQSTLEVLMGLRDWLRERREKTMIGRAKDAAELLITGRSVPAAWREPIFQAVQSENVVARRWGVNALRAFPESGAAQLLESALKDADANVRATAAISLWRMGPESALPILEKLLTSETDAFVLDSVKAVMQG